MGIQRRLALCSSLKKHKMICKILADTLYAPHLNCIHPPAARAVTTRHARITWCGHPLTNLPHLTWDQL